MPPPLTSPAPDNSSARLDAIAQARSALLAGGKGTQRLVSPWVERSWQRCLEFGLAPDKRAEFDLISPSQMRHTFDANAHLVQTAKPLLENLGRAIVNTGYFVILTNQNGVVVDVNGPIDRSDRRAELITRIGTDLSERSMGTTAIGTALSELQPVWLHRGEHFFDQTSVYSCAGAPLFGPDGACVGMLDVTGVDVQERPELKHLVMQSASKIENALITALPHALLLRLNWPGHGLGSTADALLGLDGDGCVSGANSVARQIVSGLQVAGRVHATEVFGLPLQMLFDAARRSHNTLEVPLWTGLRLNALAVEAARENLPARYDTNPSANTSVGLKDMETALIHKAVEQARGNVAQAAQALGISRATVYRKLASKTRA